MMLDKGHHGVKLSEEARDRLVTWIDFNAPYHGRWRSIVGDEALEREKLRAERRALYLGVRENHEEIELPPVVLTGTTGVPPVANGQDAHCPSVVGWPFDPVTKPAAPAQSI